MIFYDFCERRMQNGPNTLGFSTCFVKNDENRCTIVQIQPCRPSVRPSVRPAFRPSARPGAGRTYKHELPIDRHGQIGFGRRYPWPRVYQRFVNFDPRLSLGRYFIPGCVEKSLVLDLSVGSACQSLWFLRVLFHKRSKVSGSWATIDGVQIKTSGPVLTDLELGICFRLPPSARPSIRPGQGRPNLYT